MFICQFLLFIGVLFVLYIIWGFIYFVIVVGVVSWLLLMMVGICFFVVGVLLLGWLLVIGYKLLVCCLLFNVVLIGVLLFVVGNGFVMLVEYQYVFFGIVVVMVVIVLLFILCFSCFFGIVICKLEWLGIVIGFVGIVMFNSGGNLNGNFWGVLLILIGFLSWVFGLVYGL